MVDKSRPVTAVVLLQLTPDHLQGSVPASRNKPDRGAEVDAKEDASNTAQHSDHKYMQ
jgi:hypothetical protein